MRLDILTLFPGFFGDPHATPASDAAPSGVLPVGVVGRAFREGLAHVRTHDLRDFTHDRHRTVDDRPFGGGEGMVLKPQPIFDCIESLGLAPKATRDTTRESVILLSAQGQRFDQATARRLATLDRLVLICGRYEGVDERVATLLCDQELCIGDYVLSGGELAAAVVVDSVIRLLPGVLGHADSSRYESFGEADEDHPSSKAPHPQQRIDLSHPEPSDLCHPEPSDLCHPERSDLCHPERSEGSASPAADAPNTQTPPRTTNAPAGLLDYPHYTRPADFHGTPIPAPLLSGDHLAIRHWRRQAALAKTLANRPDLLAAADRAAQLTPEDRAYLATLGYPA